MLQPAPAHLAMPLKLCTCCQLLLLLGCSRLEGSASQRSAAASPLLNQFTAAASSMVPCVLLCSPHPSSQAEAAVATPTAFRHPQLRLPWQPCCALVPVVGRYGCVTLPTSYSNSSSHTLVFSQHTSSRGSSNSRLQCSSGLRRP